MLRTGEGRPTVGDGRLEIDGVSKRFGDVVALRDTTFDVRAGELFGFVGSNGAGKTTTMRIALGVLAADAGEVRWDGTPINAGDPPPHRLHARGARALPEDEGGRAARLPRPPARPVRAGREARRWRVDRAARRRAPRRDDEVQKLSLGNQQRVQLAAALVHDPQHPGAGRAVLRPRPGRGRRDEPGAAGQGRRGRPGRVLQPPARPRRAALRPGRHRRRWTDGGGRRGRRAARRRQPLRAGRRRARTPATGWATASPASPCAATRRRRTVLELATAPTTRPCSHAALATGPVTEFSRRRPSPHRAVPRRRERRRRGRRTQAGGGRHERPPNVRRQLGSWAGGRPRRRPRDQHADALQGVHHHDGRHPGRCSSAFALVMQVRRRRVGRHGRRHRARIRRSRSRSRPVARPIGESVDTTDGPERAGRPRPGGRRVDRRAGGRRRRRPCASW